MYVLNIGEYDERIFLEDHAKADIGTPTKVRSELVNKLIMLLAIFYSEASFPSSEAS